MSLTNSLTSSLMTEETSNNVAWITILIGGVVSPASIGASPASDNFPKLNTRLGCEVNKIATSPSVSFTKIEFDEKIDIDFLPDMPMKQVVKAKVIRERKMSFSSELFD